MKQVIGQQGEVRISKIEALPQMMQWRRPTLTERGYIISHSENGNHHLCTGGHVVERLDNVPAGMQMFYAFLDQPERFIQDGPAPHEGFTLEPGIWEFRVSREYDPFAEQARHVTD